VYTIKIMIVTVKFLHFIIIITVNIYIASFQNANPVKYTIYNAEQQKLLLIKITAFRQKFSAK